MLFWFNNWDRSVWSVFPFNEKRVKWVFLLEFENLCPVRNVLSILSVQMCVAATRREFQMIILRHACATSAFSISRLMILCALLRLKIIHRIFASRLLSFLLFLVVFCGQKAWTSFPAWTVSWERALGHSSLSTVRQLRTVAARGSLTLFFFPLVYYFFRSRRFTIACVEHWSVTVCEIGNHLKLSTKHTVYLCLYVSEKYHQIYYFHCPSHS